MILTTYPTVEEHDQKEKIIGGWLTLEQGAYIAVGLVGGLGSGTVFWMALHNIIVAIVFAIPPIIGALVLAFVKIHGMSILKYRAVKARFNALTENLPNCRPSYMKDVSDPNAGDMAKIYQEETLEDSSTNDEGTNETRVLIKRNLKKKERVELGLTSGEDEDNGLATQWKKFRQESTVDKD